MNFRKLKNHLAPLTLPLVLVACGGGSGSDLVNLSSLPSASGLVASTSSSTGIGFGAVVGTPPVVSSLNVDHFYGDLFTRIDAGVPNRACASQRSEFFGQVEGGVGGDTSCWMSQTVAQAVSNLTANGNSLCYMKNIPTAQSGVTISPPVSDTDVIFKQESNDKIVRVEVANDDMGSMTVFIKVYGSSTEGVGSDKYKVDLWFCGDGTVSGKESFTVDKTANTFSASGINSDGGGGGQGTFEVTSFIEIANDGTVSFDASKDRSALVQWNGGGYLFKSSIAIDGDNIVTAKEFGSGPWGQNKNFTKAEIAGSGISTLQFLQGAIRGFHVPNEDACSGCNEHSFQGATEWQNTAYRSAASSSPLLTTIPSDYRTSDSFFESGASVDVSELSSLSCDVTATYTITMDFANEAVGAIKDICESERFEWVDKCNSSTIIAERNNVFQSFGPGEDVVCSD